ncbi:General transcription factor II-I repeat domain-containing protein 2B [Merluccius polli]|uniref:General transcription factor II-I repeat domain-containing protein 2B n=1 Tax=Merluccius polli TaxID=89951 RepID=A0AA47P749_MERPO|nr:General transcription factor II-I repeat domain-containing protein 2B [Merluccius polli]
MATVKKRKVDAECRVFQEKLTNDLFFVEVKGKPVCLLTLFVGIWVLNKQLSHDHRLTENITRASFVESELIVMKLKPHAEGEFVKECLVAIAELLAPDKVKLFQSISLSRRTVADRITEIAMVGSQKGLTALVKKEMSHLSLDPSDLVVCHCIIHQESHNNVMKTIVSTINFIKSRGLNNRQFKELLSELESEYGLSL